MSKTNDIYEWIELYLLGQLEEEELANFEAKLKANKDFAEDVDIIELEMYEQDCLPPDRKKAFEIRLQSDLTLISKRNLHIDTLKAITHFNNRGSCTNQPITPLNPTPTFFVVKNKIIVFLLVKWIYWVCHIKYFLHKIRK